MCFYEFQELPNAQCNFINVISIALIEPNVTYFQTENDILCRGTLDEMCCPKFKVCHTLSQAPIPKGMPSNIIPCSLLITLSHNISALEFIYEQNASHHLHQ